MKLAYINQSKLISDSQAEAMSQACLDQINYHVAPIFDPLGRIGGVTGQFFSSKIAPIGWDVLTLFDDPDQANALGYHSESQDGSVYGKIFAKPTLSQPGTQILSGPDSVCSVLSHESIELWADRNVDKWVLAPDGNLYAYEMCDPCQGFGYELKQSYNGQKITVSDFVTPNWFDDTPPAGSKFDYLGKITTPFTISPGGYVVYATIGNPQQKFGALSNATIKNCGGMSIIAHFGSEFPEWRKELKMNEFSRTAQRFTKGLLSK